MTDDQKAPRPEAIYLIDIGDQVVWCEDSDPTGDTEPEDVTPYIRADLVTEALRHVKTAGSPHAVAAVKRLEKITGVRSCGLVTTS